MTDSSSIGGSPNIFANNFKQSISKFIVKGLASKAVLFGLYNMVAKYPTMAGIDVYQHIWPK